MADHFKSPLTLYVLWHPKFSDGEKLADWMFNTLSRNVNDPFTRTIGIPVYFRSHPAAPGSEAPAPIPLEESDYNAIIVLVDDEMLLSSEWREYVKVLLTAMANDKNSTRVFPVANDLDSFGFEELGATNYIRMFEADKRREWGPAREEAVAYESTSAETILQRRANFLVSKLVHELCRLLNSMPMTTDEGTTVSPAPLKLFLSHAKADGAEIARQIKKYIEDDSSMKTFFDANDIAAGYEFSAEIKGAIEGSALICIQTDYYATREWCLYEVIIAKRSNRPVVVLNAVKEREPRSFPYIGNVPTMRWNPDDKSAVRKVVDLALMEVLDHSYSDLFQKALRKLYQVPGIRSVGHAPELFTILNLREQERNKGNAEGATDSIKYVLYPDPPLGAEEIKLLEDLSPDMRFITPTMLPAVQQQIQSK